MFSSNSTDSSKPTKKSVAPRDTAVTILTSGCHFNGKLYCRGSSRIGGRIEGQIVSEGLLIIEEEAVITAEIIADEAIIQGKITGKLEANGRVELTATSLFEGDIASPVLVVKEGAQFNGRSTMKALEKPSHGRSKTDSLSGNNTGTKKRDPDATTGSDASVTKMPDVAMIQVPEFTV